MEYIKLNNGVMMPQVGIGTYLLAPQDARRAVKFALLNGYTMIDTANAYRNEKSVGLGIKDSGVKREDIFVSTKIWPSEYENPNAVDETLKRLGLDYIDLLFIHQPTQNWEAGYQQLVAAYKAGKIRAIGISNFEDKIEEVLKKYDVIPQVIQVECHPAWCQEKLREITDKYNINLMSWYPLGGKGNQSFLTSPVIGEIAKKHGKTPAQIIMKWHVNNGFTVIPGSQNEAHILDNINIFDFDLDEDDLKKLSSLNTHQRIFEPDSAKLEMFAKWQPEYEK